MGKRKKNWSKMIEVEPENLPGVKLDVRLFERTNGASVYYSFRLNGTKVQKSTERSDREKAEARARTIVSKVLEKRMAGRTGKPATLSEVFTLYFREKAPHLSEDYRKHARARSELFLECWGGELQVRDVDQGRVDTYVAGRRSAELSPFDEGGKGRDPIPASDGTLDGDFRWLSSVFNWARKRKRNGERLIRDNPLHDVTWPKETDPKRPVASHQRFERTMETVDQVDPMGRLRCMLALARYTGRREGAICNLTASDFLRTVKDVRAVLASLGMDERHADGWTHGAIHWRAAHDKQGLARVTPLGAKARAALDTYLAQNPRVGDVPLFPAPKDESKPIRPDLAGRWLVRAEKLAKLPKLKGGRWHPYRRLWATERKHLPDKDVAAAGGWKDTRALKQSYEHADADTVMKVVEGGA